MSQILIRKAVRSCVGVKQGDKQFIVDSPMNGNAFQEYETDKERLGNVYQVRIMNYTSKLISDELTGNVYHGKMMMNQNYIFWVKRH